MCMRLYGCGAPGYLTSYLLPVPAPRAPRFAAPPPLVPLTRLQRSNAPTSGVSASKTAELRKKNGKGVGVGAFLGGGARPRAVSISSFFEFKVNRPQTVPLRAPSSGRISPRFFIYSLFFSYVTAFKSPCFCGSVASLYSISFFLCLAPFASLPSLVAHNYTTLLSLKKKTKENKRSPK